MPESTYSGRERETNNLLEEIVLQKIDPIIHLGQITHLQNLIPFIDEPLTKEIEKVRQTPNRGSAVCLLSREDCPYVTKVTSIGTLLNQNTLYTTMLLDTGSPITMIHGKCNKTKIKKQEEANSSIRRKINPRNMDS